MLRVAEKVPSELISEKSLMSGEREWREMPPEQREETFQPKGTWALMIGFAVMLFLFWFSVYLLMLTRGATS